jgi:equilibrative nucleoside transporter 1/2/3
VQLQEEVELPPLLAYISLLLLLGIADGHVQGGMTGDLSLMCPEFIQVSLDKIFFLGKIQETHFEV